MLRAQRGSHVFLRPKYIPYTYMDPLGEILGLFCLVLRNWTGEVFRCVVLPCMKP